MRVLQQRTIVSSYLAQFRNLVIGILSINKEKKLDWFVALLKLFIKLEVLKCSSDALDDASCTALNEDSSLAGTSMFSFQSSLVGNIAYVRVPEPVKFENTESTSQYRKKSSRPRKSTV